MSEFDYEHDLGVITEQKKKVDKPKKYKVILLNDDYTSMEFVIEVLVTIFHKTPQQAMSLMLSIHHTDRGVAGVYSREIAEMKVNAVTSLARQYEYPLMCIMEEE